MLDRIDRITSLSEKLDKNMHTALILIYLNLPQTHLCKTEFLNLSEVPAFYHQFVSKF